MFAIKAWPTFEQYFSSMSFVLSLAVWLHSYAVAMGATALALISGVASETSLSYPVIEHPRRESY